MENKVCKHCNLELPITDFYKNKASEDGLTRLCKKCSHEANKKWLKDNPSKAKEHNKKWLQKNSTYTSDYYKANKEKKTAYTRQWKQNKLKNDPYFAHCNKLDIYFTNHIKAITVFNSSNMICKIYI